MTGIGCSGNIPVPLKYNIVRALHGRALSVATGIKLVRPDSEVVIFAGDGDLLSIGGNHLIHTIRRNVGIKVILVNNMLYGMTGGQVAPTTPMEAITHTTPYGNPEPPLDACRLAVSLGATYVAGGQCH
ncbi:thiamine pyrophosphate-dependent enzyme [Vulcanisaeta sp. JCM 16159]|uniref:thiamine pyrophosphate-dependent enzyme n=1 Tax=Vulcanisaeta sp. JCM 16159 TaxID=1295371 RepID=UPI000ADEDE5C|nr:thiamine pyrophosphate-dependent enzyme [Vulcanisaeta sp. JCM 16159]